MCKKLDKEVDLEVIGEETEAEKRIQKGKDKKGVITLDAKNSGSDVFIVIQDDGRGLNRTSILKKAKQQGSLTKDESEMTDKEIYSLILHPGFSTKEGITEFSGRGAGMDAVKKNIETIGETVLVESVPDRGTRIILKIPLTLAIIDGMNIKVGNSRYTIPLISIQESFRPKENECFVDPDGNEMIMVMAT